MRRNPSTQNQSRIDSPYLPGTCTAVIGSMTQAMKAQTALAEAAIRANISKISSSKTHNGCAYGVDFPCTQSGNVQMVLERAGVKVREYLRG
ncbi:MAG: DUF3343 domain-containing protein [Clostridia bacterium]|nr:DUF3343 domain-containing protein [Clostridia bacterium]